MLSLLAPRRSIGPSVRWGIGLHSAARMGQPKGVYGHGDAKSTAFMIDPVHRFFIVMTTTKRLAGFSHMSLWEAVVDGIAKP